jgi:hypothetical protein
MMSELKAGDRVMLPGTVTGISDDGIAHVELSDLNPQRVGPYVPVGMNVPVGWLEPDPEPVS